MRLVNDSIPGCQIRFGTLLDQVMASVPLTRIATRHFLIYKQRYYLIICRLDLIYTIITGSQWTSRVVVSTFKVFILVKWYCAVKNNGGVKAKTFSLSRAQGALDIGSQSNVQVRDYFISSTFTLPFVIFLVDYVGIMLGHVGS